jgi:hypothetical protein
MRIWWRRGHQRVAVAVALGVLGILVVCGTAVGDPSGPFATLSGSVAPFGSQTFNAPPVIGSHGSVMVRLAVLSGTSNVFGGVVGDTGPYAFAFTPGSMQWLPTTVSYGPGDSPGFSVANNDASLTASFTAQFYDLPAAPATYSGASVYDSTSFATQDSNLEFVVPGSAQYVVDLSLSGGAVTLSGGPSPQTFASSGLYPLGQLTAGQRTLAVTPVTGPPAQWSVTIRALPVSVYGASFDVAYAPAGAIDTLRYSTTGQADMTATVTNSAGQLVRTIASGFTVGAGAQSLVWDGRDSAGNALPDRTYTVGLTSTDPFGNRSATSASITLDSTPPTVTMTSPGTITPSQGASFQVTDSGSGVSSATLLVDGLDVGDWGGSNAAFPVGGVISAPGPWMTGTNSWEIYATDNAGNQADVKGHFTVAVAPPPLPAGVFVGGLHGFSHHPATLTLSVSRMFVNLRWSGWASPVANGNGTERVRSAGPWRSYSAQVQLSRVQVCGGRRVYTRARYRIPGRKWASAHRVGCRLTP